MLLILIVVHLLSQDSIAAPLSHPPNARATTDSESCNDINNRSLFGIVWGCLATIFVCTWVSAHPNVPPPNQNLLQLFWRRLKMMLIGIIAPEVMVGFAARQFFASRSLSKRDVGYTISKTHGFFVCMGGFVSPAGHPIATVKQLEDSDLGSKLQDAIRNVKKEEIKDKSKGDALSKGVALLQCMWFILQCLARAHQHLAITQLEVATLAFAIVNIFIWSLWWNKPLDVQRPIVVGPRALPDSDSQAIQLSRGDRFWGAINGDERNPRIRASSSRTVLGGDIILVFRASSRPSRESNVIYIPDIEVRSTERRVASRRQEPKDVDTLSDHCKTFSLTILLRRSPHAMVEQYRGLTVSFCEQGGSKNGRSATVARRKGRLPSFWSVNYDTAEAGFFLLLVGAVFGGIHCAAWNAIFPTPAEMWIWRTSSLVIAAIAGLLCLLGMIGTTIDGYWGEDSAPVLTEVFGAITMLTILIYTAARLILIVLPLAELRSLPASAFVDVNWSTYIPHI
ncbi:hypothetical protein C8R45DRAFT_917237 [Mycena sanguinolenta]|nr:hypothetical protein C8R45DRAFT_917237 [Mycena sanguinolenta]